MTNQFDKLEKEIIDARRLEPKIEMEQMFGDIIITLLRAPNGDLYIKLRRGMPPEKTFSLEHFCMLVQKFNIVFQEIQKRGGR